MSNYGPSQRLREFHKLFSAKRDHKVDAQYMGGGNLGGYYECRVCGEMLEHGGKRHQVKRIEAI